MILLTVTGIFREKNTSPSSSSSSYRSGNNSNDQLLRSFQRSLVIIPSGAGYCIINEMLHVNTLTIAQSRTAFKPLELPVTPPVIPAQPGPIAASAAVPIVTPTPITAATNLPVVPPNDEVKLQMVQAMATMSQMNMEWSKRLVEFTSIILNEFQKYGVLLFEILLILF